MDKYFRLEITSVIDPSEVGVVNASLQEMLLALRIFSEPEFRLWQALCEKYPDMPANWFRDKLDRVGMKVGKTADDLIYSNNTDSR